MPLHSANISVCPGKFIPARCNAVFDTGAVTTASQILFDNNWYEIFSELNAAFPDSLVGYPAFNLNSGKIIIETLDCLSHVLKFVHSV